VVIAADGRASRLASALGLSRFAASPRRWAFGAYFQGVTGQNARGEMHVRRDGYIGVAPLPCGLTNVCVVRDGVSGFSRTGNDIVADAVANDRVLRDRFAPARQVSAVTTLGPLAIDSRAPGCPGLLLAGDAAGFIDPMTGDGLRFALRGGILAAEAALRELDTGQPAWQSLAANRTHEFAGKWRINRVLRRLVGSPAGVDLAARLAAHWDAPVRYLIGVAGDVALARG
jgi:flavin-dependent dehydrogenase